MPVPLKPNAILKYEGPILKVYQYEQTLYDDSTATFETMVRPDTASILAFLDADTILVTREEQPQKSQPFWALPGGRLDEGELPLIGIKRELREETGYEATTIEHWHTRTWSGIASYEEHIFVAKGLSLSSSGVHLDPGEKITLVPMPWKDLVKLALAQELRGSTLTATILATEFDPETNQRLKKFLA